LADADYGEAPAERISEVRPVVLSGDVDAGTDLSGVVVVGDHLVLGADEGHSLQFFRREEAEGSWRLATRLALAKRDQEADIEAITANGGHLYVVGSHSTRRKRLKPEHSLRKNRERLLQVQSDPARNRLFRIAFDPAAGTVGKLEQIDLGKRLRKDPLLGLFVGVPSKENGIDIEGLAFRDGRLYVGFRGPVLRDNYVPVMTLEFDRPKQYVLKFVRLDGQGIRDMVAIADGLLILSGPVNDAPGPFCLWWWDGNDQVPGKDRPVKETVLLGQVSTPGGAKAEGLALLSESPGEAQVLVVYDTNTTAQAVSMRLDLTL
jgi:hypothetical protein